MVEVYRDGEAPERITKGDVPLRPGDRVKLYSGGGGGYGDPKERERDAVVADLRAGYISEESARDHYVFADSSETSA